MNNIHENKQSELMSSIYQRFKFFRGSTTTARSKKIGDMVPTVKYAGKQIEPGGIQYEVMAIVLKMLHIIY